MDTQDCIIDGKHYQYQAEYSSSADGLEDISIVSVWLYDALDGSYKPLDVKAVPIADMATMLEDAHNQAYQDIEHREAYRLTYGE